MKHGKTLTELAIELDRQAATKRDFVASTEQIELNAEDNSIVVGDDERFDVTDHTHRQLGGWAGIPAKYYDVMRKEQPELLSTNVNTWLHEKPATRLVRTLDGNARAFLSNRYQRIDNMEIAEMVLPIFHEMGGVEVVSCEVTDKKLYIKAVTPKVEGELGLNDPVQAGVVISNSEIGGGAVNISPLIYRLVCLNGMILPTQMRRNHVGRKVEDSDEAYEIFADDTREADDKAVLLKVRDVTRSAFDELVFNRHVSAFAETKEDKIEARPVKAVEELANSFALNETEGDSILQSLIEGGDMSRFGLINAVTAAAQTVESYDRSTEMEVMGSKLMDLDRTSWRQIAEAA